MSPTTEERQNGERFSAGVLSVSGREPSKRSVLSDKSSYRQSEPYMFLKTSGHLFRSETIFGSEREAYKIASDGRECAGTWICAPHTGECLRGNGSGLVSSHRPETIPPPIAPVLPGKNRLKAGNPITPAADQRFSRTTDFP